MKGGKKRFDVMGHLPLLRRYARSLTRHDANAEDLVHDTLVRAYGREAESSDGRSIRDWLLSLTYRTFIDGWRSRRSEDARVEQYTALLPRDAPPLQTEHVGLRQIGDALEQLPDEQRSVLHLVLIEGMAYEEVAALLEIPVGTVMSRLSRGRAALRQAYQAKEEGPREGLRTGTGLYVVRRQDDQVG